MPDPKSRTELHRKLNFGSKSHKWLQFTNTYTDLTVNIETTVHSQLSEGPLLRNVIVQILKFDAKPNPNPSPNPNPMPYDNWNLGQVNPRTTGRTPKQQHVIISKISCTVHTEAYVIKTLLTVINSLLVSSQSFSR